MLASGTAIIEEKVMHADVAQVVFIHCTVLLKGQTYTKRCFTFPLLTGTADAVDYRCNADEDVLITP